MVRIYTLEYYKRCSGFHSVKHTADCGCIFTRDKNSFSRRSRRRPKGIYYLCHEHYDNFVKLKNLKHRADRLLSIINKKYHDELHKLYGDHYTSSKRHMHCFIDISDIGIDVSDINVSDIDKTDSFLGSFQGAILYNKSLTTPNVLINKSQEILADLSLGLLSLDDVDLDACCQDVSKGALGQHIYHACKNSLWSVAEKLFDHMTDEMKTVLQENIPGMYEHIEEMIATKEYKDFWK